MLFITHKLLKVKCKNYFYQCYVSHFSNKTRVVVTGLGIVSPLGVGVKCVWEKLLKGETGVVSINDTEYNDIPCKVAAYVPHGEKPGELNLKEIFRDSDLKKMSLSTAYALIAAKEALENSNWLPTTEEDCETTGVAVGTGMVDLQDIISTGNVLKNQGYSKVSPFFVPRILANMPAGHIAMKYGLKGPNHSVSTACATGLHSIGDAFNFIKNGHATVMVCGSSEAVISPVSIAGFSRMRALATCFNNQPQKASRPFDKNRDGFVMGEGAGILVLETLEHAIKRNASIYCEILGYGLSCDAYHITSPSKEGNGAYRCMEQGIIKSGIGKTDVGYINAHATSTPLGDDIELKAIYDLFGKHSETLTVSSTKGATGHLLGAAGSIEAIFTILACFYKFIPPNVNLDSADSQWPVNIASELLKPWPNELCHKRIGLTNSFGFGGTNASLVFCDSDEKYL